MAKIFIYLKYRPEIYDVVVDVYDEQGKHLSRSEYSGVKQVVVRAREVRVSAQLSSNPFALVIDVSKPYVELSGKDILYVGERNWIVKK